MAVVPSHCHGMLHVTRGYEKKKKDENGNINYKNVIIIKQHKKTHLSFCVRPTDHPPRHLPRPMIFSYLRKHHHNTPSHSSRFPVSLFLCQTKDGTFLLVCAVSIPTPVFRVVTYVVLYLCVETKKNIMYTRQYVHGYTVLRMESSVMPTN